MAAFGWMAAGTGHIVFASDGEATCPVFFSKHRCVACLAGVPQAAEPAVGIIFNQSVVTRFVWAVIEKGGSPWCSSPRLLLLNFVYMVCLCISAPVYHQLSALVQQFQQYWNSCQFDTIDLTDLSRGGLECFYCWCTNRSKDVLFGSKDVSYFHFCACCIISLKGLRCISVVAVLGAH